MTYRTLGIVLRRRDVREHDRLYTIFTREHGKIEAIARGSKRLTSKLSPHLESFATVDLLIAKGRLWDHVAGVEAVEMFPDIGSRFLTMLAANYALESTDVLTKLGLRDLGLWNLILEYMRALNALRSGTPVIRLREVARAYICQLLSRLGVAPELDKCQNCKKDDVEFTELSPSGVLCEACSKLIRREQSMLLSESALIFLRKYHSEPLRFFIEERNADAGAFRAVDFLLKTQVGSALKTEKIFSLS